MTKSWCLLHRSDTVTVATWSSGFMNCQAHNMLPCFVLPIPWFIRVILKINCNTGCSERRLIGHSFYRRKFRRKRCATCWEKCRHRLIGLLSTWCHTAAFYSASGAALSQEVPTVNWMSNWPALWTYIYIYVHLVDHTMSPDVHELMMWTVQGTSAIIIKVFMSRSQITKICQKVDPCLQITCLHFIHTDCFLFVLHVIYIQMFFHVSERIT
jgi:hypothetical protein